MKIIKLTMLVSCALSALSVTQARGQTAPERGQNFVEQRFKQWDRNGDGKLTPDEVPGERLFKMLDRNGDGVVTLEEAKAFGGGDRRVAKGKGKGTAELPLAEGFKPRPHGDEANTAGLKPEVLAALDRSSVYPLRIKILQGLYLCQLLSSRFWLQLLQQT
jgi:hypothetical protein